MPAMDETNAGALRRMRPLAWGLLLVVLDLRIEGLDLVPDPVGWLVALVALGPLASRHSGFAAAVAGCGLGLLVSLPDWVQPESTWLGLVATAAETLVVVGTCTALMVLLPRRRAGAATIRAWNLGLTVVAVALGAVAAAGEGVPVALVLLVVVAALVALACFLVLLFQVAGDARKFGPSTA